MTNRSIKRTYNFPDASTFIETWDLIDEFNDEFGYELNNITWKTQFFDAEVIERLLHRLDGEYVVRYNKYAERFEVIELCKKVLRVESEGDFIPPIDDSPGREINDSFIIENFLGKTFRIKKRTK